LTLNVPADGFSLVFREMRKENKPFYQHWDTYRRDLETVSDNRTVWVLRPVGIHPKQFSKMLIVLNKPHGPKRTKTNAEMVGEVDAVFGIMQPGLGNRACRRDILSNRNRNKERLLSLTWGDGSKEGCSVSVQESR